MTLRSALLPLVLVLGATACNGDDDTDDTDIGTDSDTEMTSTTIAAIASGDERFTTLVAAAARVGLDVALDSPDIDYTVFAPTNDAFDALFAAVPGVDSLDDLPDASIMGILAYHAIPVEVMSDDIPARADSLADLTLFFNVGDTVMVNQATVVEADIDASNGVIHAIDSVLVPLNIAQAAGFAGLTELSTAVGASSTTTQGLLGNPDPVADPITVFAPINDAFTGVTLPSTEAEVDALLAYHVVDGAVLAADIGATAATLATNDDDQNLSVVFGTNTDGNVTINDAIIVDTDIKATNGVIHLVDEILMPGSVVDLAAWAELNALATQLGNADLITTLETGVGWTIFAPTDAAFDALASVPTGDALSATLAYHAIAGSEGILAADLATDSYTTVNGATLAVDVSAGVTVNGANVIIADVVGTNGVVHVIDEVLLPPTN